MGKKKNKNNDPQQNIFNRCIPRGINKRDRRTFERRPRSYNCLQDRALYYSKIEKLNENRIYWSLTYNASTIEHQIYLLRRLTTDRDNINLEQRRKFTQCLLECLYEHHGVVYQGILFGSSVNGLGFLDSDIDLRIRPLMQISHEEFEPITYDYETGERVLRNIAFQTTRCSRAVGEFRPSFRCPIAKLTFIQRNSKTLEEGWKYDISLSSSPLGSLNSCYMRFLCCLEPKFHLLAMTLRYWAKAHDLISSGLLSSYALINMLIFFLQNTDPPLLPTVDEMRDTWLCHHDITEGRMESHAITQLDWQCLIDMDEENYQRSNNNDSLCLLLLKFFEFYLKFSYSSNIITTRTGSIISFEDFPTSSQYHKQFPLKVYLNIQDPFDLKHNLTSGMTGKHFMLFMLTMRCSYERLSDDIIRNFKRPKAIFKKRDDSRKGEACDKGAKRSVIWGINKIFAPLTDEDKEGFL